MPQPRIRIVEQIAGVAVVWLALSATSAAQEPTTSGTAGTQTPAGLRTFELPKPAPAVAPAVPLRASGTAARLPPSKANLRTMIGVGYVQGADWGSEILAGGTVAGTQVQLNTLLTGGRDGLLFDHGSLSVSEPDAGWRIEAGDVFSHLRGAAIGGRVSWKGAWSRTPAIAVYAPRRGTLARNTVVTYRDGLQFRGQTLLDAEIASDRSYLLRSRIAFPAFEIEAFHRSMRVPARMRDVSVSAGVNLWRGVSLNAGMFRSVDAGQPHEWRLVSVRFPLFRIMDLTLERAIAGSGETSQTTSAVMGGIAAGDLRLFHRYQHGEYTLPGAGLGSIERQQIRSMSSYSRGSRFNVTLQLASQRTETGQVQHWEELQTSTRITSTTTLRTVTAVPDVGNRERFQAYLRQELPRRFTLQADYGRISAYQSIPRELDRSRLKLMVFKTVDLATPARGATVTGQVLDMTGRAVGGARVRLGPYSTDTDDSGSYRFPHVPRGIYELSLDRTQLPADYAWDGRGETLPVSSTRTLRRDLRVTPLNAIHGRVYHDANGNGRFDAGEGVRGAVLMAGDRLTATDADGAYSFYNMWPGRYDVTLQGVPSTYQIEQPLTPVTLRDDAPVTGADFRVLKKEKPIIWGTPGG